MPRATGKQGALLAFALVILVLVPLRAPAARPGVIIQVDDASLHTWRIALANTTNLLAAERVAHPHPHIEIIALGRAAMMLRKKAPYWKKVLALHKQGLQITACLSDLRRLHLHKADMSPAVHYIPSGIAEIVRRKREGWAYVQP
ncbi:MAG: hypothetical protein M0Z44_07585 [Gammaproteobacteria bacterium]|nr:hypothetical protein [Gammaproteobacteria bacterium]